MYAQIVYKDSKILEMDNRILELERNVMDLQENLKEKDEVIQARNKAIQVYYNPLVFNMWIFWLTLLYIKVNIQIGTLGCFKLMTEDLSRRGKAVVDQLDDTRDQMRSMQENFASAEADWKEEKRKLTEQIKESEANLKNAILEKDKRYDIIKCHVIILILKNYVKRNIYVTLYEICSAIHCF